LSGSTNKPLVASASLQSAEGAVPTGKLTPVQWLVCAVACLGFAFDLYETLMMALIIRPALTDLGHLRPGTPGFNLWVGLLFYIPNVLGGVFGLLGGYLTDLFGRKRILVWSILLYSVSACAASFSTSPTQLLLFRCGTLVGVSVEFVAAITWLAELFPSPRRRESILGFTQAFHAVGGLMVAGAYYLAVTHAEAFPMIRGGHEAWRYTLLSGLIPALPLLLVRPFLPESPLWREKKSKVRQERPRISELFQPALRKTTLVATLLFACSYALPLGAIQHTVRMVSGLADLQSLSPRQLEQVASGVQMFQELGGTTGRLLFALFVVHIVSQRRRALVFFVPSLIVFPFLYFFAATRTLALLHLGIFLATMLFNGLHSFWGNYLPRVYPTRLRATGESFAANIGGRVLGVTAAVLTTTLSNVMPGAGHAAQLAHSAGTVALFFLVLGVVGTFWLREPEGDRLPD
jgi:MFS family permease